ncbi:hypothetical protein Pgy4_39360, partial [Pseudomonas savastanoi pv. glycinea str. race 4]
ENIRLLQTFPRLESFGIQVAIYAMVIWLKLKIVNSCCNCISS